MFITFEGGEGAGKSTLARRVFEELKRDKSVIFTREPGGTPFGEEIRNWLLHKKDDIKITARAELFLFLAARAQHIEEVIEPALRAGKIVLCDRFSDSTVAYQGEARGLGLDYVLECSDLACMHLRPDLTFFVDLEPKLGLERVARRRARSGKADRIEEEEFSFHESVYKGFLALAQAFPERIVKLDGHMTEDQLVTEAMKHVNCRLSG
jgi:dTMP kinase